MRRFFLRFSYLLASSSRCLLSSSGLDERESRQIHSTLPFSFVIGIFPKSCWRRVCNSFSSLSTFALSVSVSALLAIGAVELLQAVSARSAAVIAIAFIVVCPFILSVDCGHYTKREEV